MAGGQSGPQICIFDRAGKEMAQSGAACGVELPRFAYGGFEGFIHGNEPVFALYRQHVH